MKKKSLFLSVMIFLMLACVMPCYAASRENVQTTAQSATQKGLKKENGKFYYYVDGKKVKNQWVRVKSNGRKYYFKNNGAAATGSYKVKGSWYVFNRKGQLLEPASTKIIELKGNLFYCVDSKGRPLPGWRVINNKLYYVYANGSCATNKTISDIQLTKKAYATGTNASLKIMTMTIISKITNSGMSQSQKLSACWSYVSGGSFTYAMKYPNLNQNGWQRTTALNMFQTHTGNCYSYACAFAALAEEIGYDATVVCARIPGGRDQAQDGYTRHAWVKINGLHYDPEAQYAGWYKGIYGYSSYPMSFQLQKYVSF